ncbi:hypothetical protein EN868_11200 [Mesorhizobium sp. M2D.F.Ca.ET.225.01.1.1]|nr:hypothetical protein [Mesorhizobium sp. M2D.F.Ca.ET.225.01.1.1]TGP69186.1 hypothetical protein EN868_11200 [Mesorhizobium sp. M2D.F.Ca.ET.225.01.1.1]
MKQKPYHSGQWVVTGDGMTGDGWYFIAADRLEERRGSGQGTGHYDWPLHMVDKTWVDVEQFLAAITVALERHCPGYDREELAWSADNMREHRARQDRRKAVRQRLFPPKKNGPIFEAIDLAKWSAERAAIDAVIAAEDAAIAAITEEAQSKFYMWQIGMEAQPAIGITDKKEAA